MDLGFDFLVIFGDVEHFLYASRSGIKIVYQETLYQSLDKNNLIFQPSPGKLEEVSVFNSLMLLSDPQLLIPSLLSDNILSESIWKFS